MGQRIKTSQQFNEYINSNAQNPSLANVLSSLRLSCYEAIEGL